MFKFVNARSKIWNKDLDFYVVHWYTEWYVQSSLVILPSCCRAFRFQRQENYPEKRLAICFGYFSNIHELKHLPHNVAVMVFFSFDPTTETLLLHFGVRILLQFGLHCKKRNFPLRISSVNVTKSAGNYGFSHIYWRNSPWKISFFAVLDSLSLMWVFGLFQFSKRSDGDSPFQFFTYFFWDAKIPRCNLQA